MVDYNGTESGGATNTNFEYDAAGNLIDDGRYRYVYDAFGRLSLINCAADNRLVVDFDYDALDRRSRKSVAYPVAGSTCPVPDELVSAGPGEVFYYDGNRVVEYFRSVAVGAPTPGDYSQDACTSGGGGGQTSKEIAEASAETPKSPNGESGQASPLDTGGPEAGPAGGAKAGTGRLVHDVVPVRPTQPPPLARGAEGDQGGSPMGGSSRIGTGGSSGSTAARVAALRQLRESGALAHLGIPAGSGWGSEPRPSGSGPGATGGSPAREGATSSSPEGKRSEVTMLGPPGTIEPRLVRRFVYGLHYIDELVAMLIPPQSPTDTSPPKVRYVLQDVNHNVVGVTRACDGKVIRQMRYTPYGEREVDAVAYNVGGSVSLSNPPKIDIGQGPWTQWVDRETGLVQNRHRYYRPEWGRPISRDPNETGLLVGTVMLYNAQTPSASASFSAGGQYFDSANPFQWLRSNPVNGTDPMGLYGQFDWMGESEDLENDLIGHRLYALGALNEGARWASLGLQTALDIGSSLLGIDVFQSVAVLASGRGGFWESMDIVMAVAPFGFVGKVVTNVAEKTGKAGARIGKGFGYLRKSSRAVDIVGTAAEHLFKIVPYRQAQKLTAGHRGAIVGHHILESRHLRSWGLDGEIANAPAVILTHAEHVRVTNALQARLPYSTAKIARRYDQRQVWEAYKEVYTDLGYGEWLEYIEKYFR